MIEREFQYRTRSFARKPAAAETRVHHPADLSGSMVCTYKPQQYTPDRYSIVFNHESQRMRFAVKVSLRQSLGHLPGRIVQAPRFIQQIAGDALLRIYAVQPY